MVRQGNAHWEGSLKDGRGQISAESGVLAHAPYAYATRFYSGEHGTNPEELIAAAHAACFSMALANKLDGFAESIDTTATLTLDHLPEAGWGIPHVHLDCRIHAPGAKPDDVMKEANDAKLTCPVSRLLASTRITLEAHLV